METAQSMLQDLVTERPVALVPDRGYVYVDTQEPICDIAALPALKGTQGQPVEETELAAEREHFLLELITHYTSVIAEQIRAILADYEGSLGAKEAFTALTPAHYSSFRAAAGPIVDFQATRFYLYRCFCNAWTEVASEQAS